MKKIIVLGAGMVGRAMAIDLAKNHLVCATDINKEALEYVRSKNNTIDTLILDASDKEALRSAIAEYDIVVSAVPGFMGYKTLEEIIRSGKDVVDISFFPENALDLDALAKANGVRAIVDCGVAPGMDNVILGYYNEKMKLEEFECLVGGLPRSRKWPFEYKAPFSPVDVIEEYTRPARYVENGEMVTKEALSDIEHVYIDGLGTLESFNSDGLRSIIFTMPHIKNMKEKTLRYPGHAIKMKMLRDSGFFSEEQVMWNGQEIRPIDFTSKILFKEWKLGDTEEELTVMRVRLKGVDTTGERKEITYTLHDTYDPVTQTSSMARSTGYTATAAVNILLEGVFTDQGVFPPELVGKYPSCFDYFMNYLNERSVIYKKQEVSLRSNPVQIEE